MLLCPPSWTHDPITVATVVIAVATVVNLIVSAGLWYATARTATIAQHAFEAANRPYVGLESLIPGVDQTKRTLDITAVVKNFGTVPAEETTLEWEIFLNDVAPPTKKIPDKPSIIFPTDTVRLHAHFEEPSYGQILAGTVTLLIVMRVVYQGPGKKSYVYKEKYQYDPMRNVFFNLGRVE